MLPKIKPAIALLVFGVLISFVPVIVAHAAISENCPDGYTVTFNPGGSGPTYSELCEDHQTGGPTSDSREAQQAGGASSGSTSTSRQGDCTASDIDPGNCGILSYFVDAVKLLSALVGIIITIMIVIGGMQYSAARDNPQAAAAAKEKIRNAILALVAFLFAFIFLQYIVPGGVL